MDTPTPAAPTKTTSNAPKRTTYKGAEIMVEYLIKEKVPYLFGVCGHGNIGFLDAACSAADRIRTISVHHEQAAGYMADAYYKVKHQPVATYTSCGPGSCNMPVALAGAMMDSSAFLAITGNVPTTQFNRMPFQETGRYFQGDFPSVIRPLVKKSFQPSRVEMLPLAMKQAFGLLHTGRPGPVNIDVPLNVFQESAECEVPDPDPLVMQRAPGDLGALDKARRARHLLQSWGFASMGFATCGILGAKLAQPESPAIAVVGDGSFMMTPHILATAVEYDIPAVWVVWNNYGYCSIRDMQLGMFGQELATSFQIDKTKKLFSTDFVMLARSMGVDGAKVERAADLEGVLETAIKANRPYLVEVPVDRDIRPVGTGTWQLPPFPHAEPNFRKLAGLEK